MDLSCLQLTNKTSWVLVTRHSAHRPLELLLGCPATLLGVSKDKFLDSGFSGIAVAEPVCCFWQQASAPVYFLAQDDAGNCRWFQAQSVSDGQSGWIVTTRQAPIGENVETMLNIARLCLGASLLGSMAHELNNAVQGLASAEYLIRDSLESGDPVEMEDVEQLAEVMNTIKRLSSGVQGFSRSRLSEPEEVPIRDLIEKAIEFLTSIGKLKTIDVLCTGPEEGPDLYWKRIELEFIVQALLVNAAESASSHESCPTIGIAWEVQEDILCLTVTNSGLKTDNFTQNAAPFYSTKAPHRHVGIGLSVLLQIVRSAGGSVRQSVEETGSSIELSLPLDVRKKSLAS